MADASIETTVPSASAVIAAWALLPSVTRAGRAGPAGWVDSATILAGNAMARAPCTSQRARDCAFSMIRTIAAFAVAACASGPAPSGSSTTAPAATAAPRWYFCSGPDTRSAVSPCTIISLPWVSRTSCAVSTGGAVTCIRASSTAWT